MKAHSPISIRHKLQSLSLFLVLTTSILGMATTLLFSLRMEYQNLDRNLMNSAQVLAQSPDVADFLAHRADSSVLTHYLNGTISRVQDIDAIVVADHNGVIRYCPDPAFVGTVYPDVDTLTVLRGELTEVDTGAGISGAEHRALAAVHDLDGSLLGFVSVGIGVRSVHQIVLDCPAICPAPSRRPCWAMSRTPSARCSTSARTFWRPWRRASSPSTKMRL